MEAPVVDMNGAVLRTVDLPDEVFGLEPNRALMHQALVRQLANARRGTHKTQSRGEVSRTKSKWFRQKGTGRARHGSRSANLFVGGAVSHGPTPRSYRQAMPRTMRRQALRSALSVKAREEAIVLVEDLALETPKTRHMAGLVERACDGASTLFVLATPNEAAERSIRNLENARYLRAGYLNVRDLLGFDRIVIPLETLDAIVAHLGVADRGDAAVAAETESEDGDE